jgi:hypothetical protein
MMYGSSMWSCCSRNDLLKIFKLQKRAARVILGTDTSSRSIANFNKLNWTPFYEYLKQKIFRYCILINFYHVNMLYIFL